MRERALEAPVFLAQMTGWDGFSGRFLRFASQEYQGQKAAKSSRLEQRNKSVLFSQWTSPRRTQGYRVVRAALSTTAPEHLAPRNEAKHGLRVR